MNQLIAQASTSVKIPIEPNLTGNVITNIGSYTSNIVGAALMMGALATVLYLVWGGISWITAGGDKGKIEEARNRITGALVGSTIVALSWAIFLILDSFFGLNMAGGRGGGGKGGTGGGGTGGGQRGLCVAKSICPPGKNGVGTYCTNSLYVTQQFGDCGNNKVYCDRVVK